MVLAVIRVRGTLKVKPDIKETMKLLRLNQVNHCVVIPDTKEYKGMLQKSKDYITWGDIEQETLIDLLKTRGKIDGDAPLTDDYIKAKSSFKGVEEFAEALMNNKIKFKDIEGVKPVFRLAPPIKGGYEGIKRGFSVGGALGYRGAEINKLIKRMI